MVDSKSEKELNEADNHYSSWEKPYDDLFLDESVDFPISQLVTQTVPCKSQAKEEIKDDTLEDFKDKVDKSFSSSPKVSGPGELFFLYLDYSCCYCYIFFLTSSVSTV